SGSLTVWSSIQHPYMVRRDLANVFNLPLNRVRVVVPYVGGGYGSKSYTKIDPLVAFCAWKIRRPVKIALSVEEAMFTTQVADATIKLKTAFSDAGRMLARKAELFFNNGAYADNGPLGAHKAADRIL